MSRIEDTLENIRKDSQPNCHLIYSFLDEAEQESHPENLEVARTYLEEKHSDQGLSPEDEANLRYLAELEETEYIGEKDPVTRELLGAYQDSN